jgi:hypothetical protein
LSKARNRNINNRKESKKKKKKQKESRKKENKITSTEFGTGCTPSRRHAATAPSSWDPVTSCEADQSPCLPSFVKEGLVHVGILVAGRLWDRK